MHVITTIIARAADLGEEKRARMWLSVMKCCVCKYDVIDRSMYDTLCFTEALVFYYII